MEPPIESLFEELAASSLGIPPGTLTAAKMATSSVTEPESNPSQKTEVHHITSYEAELTTRILQDYSPSDYKFKWKCGPCETWPNVEGPQHDPNCKRFRPAFALHTETAHKHECRFCGAVPYVPGTHHMRGCRRREKELVDLDPTGFNYKTDCKHCGARPFSQGPHHYDCQRKWDYTAYSTKLAHKKKCRYCTARPFPAGPHHRTSCKRYLPYSDI